MQDGLGLVFCVVSDGDGRQFRLRRDLFEKLVPRVATGLFDGSAGRSGEIAYVSLAEGAGQLEVRGDARDEFGGAA
jgi:hypothetical protein